MLLEPFLRAPIWCSPLDVEAPRAASLHFFTHEETSQGLATRRSTPQASKQARAPRIRARVGGVDLSDGC
jgi:hypothetical protein